LKAVGTLLFYCLLALKTNSLCVISQTMPRQARLDIPNLLYHIIARGIERRTIFRDDTDRYAFINRYQKLLVETDTECFAWTLMPNHFHLLLRPHNKSLSNFMRRLLTGYAVTFNLRHKRSGHLFQNRYKSIICEEDVYMLELIRYIHLNPLRAKLILDIDSLDIYPWSGHAELLGNYTDTCFSCLSQDSVLRLFGKTLVSARQTYHQFIADGIKVNSKFKLSGGGVQHSQSLKKVKGKSGDFDNRILGSSKFVASLQHKGLLDIGQVIKMTLLDLQKLIEAHYNLTDQQLLNRGRKNTISKARNLFCYCGVKILGNSVTKVSQHLKIGPSSVTRSVRNGAQLVNDEENLRFWIEKSLK